MCPTLANPPNGTVSNPSVDFQAEATYTCVNDSFYLDGPATRICQADGQWSDTEPSCISKSFYISVIVSVTYSCLENWSESVLVTWTHVRNFHTL